MLDQLPRFQSIDVQPAPFGLVVRPRTHATSYLIEAAVWVIAAAVCAALIVLGGETAALIGYLLLVPIGIRALVRTIRFFISKSLRKLDVAWQGPFPRVAGPLAQMPLPAIARFDIQTARGDRYFCAVDHGGRTAYLVTLEPEQDADYLAFASWLRAQPFVGPVHSPGAGVLTVR